jgi:hypothetical protein
MKTKQQLTSGNLLTELAAVVATLGVGSAAAAQTDTVDTRIGTPSFSNDYPSQETVARLYDELDF